MIIRQVRWIPYQVPLHTEFGTARDSTSLREGLIVRLVTEEGIVGIGEVAPMPAFSGATIADSLAFLQSCAPNLIGTAIEELWDDAAGSEAGHSAANAAVRCGLNVAAGDALGQLKGLPFARLIVDQPAEVVPLNATVAVANRDDAARLAREAIESGFACVKVKVGMATSVEDEVNRIEHIRAAVGPKCRLRLDANGAWDVDQAIETINALSRSNVDLVEQPVEAGNLIGMAQVRKKVGVRIGADESVTGIDGARRVLECEAADVLIVKPMLVGGIVAGRRIVELAIEAGVGIIVTTSVDTGIGIAAALHLAATLPTPMEACGLATGYFLACELLRRSLPVLSGSMTVPNGFGLGVEIDNDALQAYRSTSFAAGYVPE